MSAKVKLLSCISLFVLMLAVAVLGVFALGSQTITLEGNINFNIADKSLWVKSVSISNDNISEEPIDDFLPGYINSNFNLAISDQINNYGSFTLHFDIINTKTTAYNVETSYSGINSGVEVSATPSQIPAATTEITEITSSTPSTQLDIMVTNPNLTAIDLSDITISFTEYQPINYTELGYEFIPQYSGVIRLNNYTGTDSIVNVPATVSQAANGDFVDGDDYQVCFVYVEEWSETVKTIDLSNAKYLVEFAVFDYAPCYQYLEGIYYPKDSNIQVDFVATGDGVEVIDDYVLYDDPQENVNEMKKYPDGQGIAIRFKNDNTTADE